MCPEFFPRRRDADDQSSLVAVAGVPGLKDDRANQAPLASPPQHRSGAQLGARRKRRRRGCRQGGVKATGPQALPRLTCCAKSPGCCSQVRERETLPRSVKCVAGHPVLHRSSLFAGTLGKTGLRLQLLIFRISVRRRAGFLDVLGRDGETSVSNVNTGPTCRSAWRVSPRLPRLPAQEGSRGGPR